MPAHVLYGDTFLVPEALNRLKSEAGIDELLDANYHQLQGNQVNPAELISMCGALPFMDSHRLVVVTGLLARQERRTGERRRSGGRSQRGEGGQQTPALGGWEGLQKSIPEMPDTTMLVFIEGAISDSNPLLRLLKPLSKVQALKAPSGEGLARWIKDAAQFKGAKISPTAIKSLGDLVGSDLWTLDRELEKLSLYATGRAIEESDVGELVAQVREGNIFAAVDAMIDGKPGVALRLLHQLRQDGRDISSIIAMVERQLRLMALARDSIERGLPQSEVAKRLGTSSEFVVRKTMDQARRHSWQGIKARYRRLLEADLAIKRGIMEPDLALELLVAEQATAR
ncbi:MAG: DNA polymerase III subunit delta [SAR202 cluster bacterium Io17-Chloro-G7]|nr:MAG: DNA polymerase III subunit delta [SAR202 cluster bacterium Io17-Chloro-G7]